MTLKENNRTGIFPDGTSMNVHHNTKTREKTSKTSYNTGPNKGNIRKHVPVQNKDDDEEYKALLARYHLLKKEGEKKDIEITSLRNQGIKFKKKSVELEKLNFKLKRLNKQTDLQNRNLHTHHSKDLDSLARSLRVEKNRELSRETIKRKKAEVVIQRNLKRVEEATGLKTKLQTMGRDFEKKYGELQEGKEKSEMALQILLNRLEEIKQKYSLKESNDETEGNEEYSDMVEDVDAVLDMLELEIKEKEEISAELSDIKGQLSTTKVDFSEAQEKLNTLKNQTEKMSLDFEKKNERSQKEIETVTKLKENLEVQLTESTDNLNNANNKRQLLENQTQKHIDYLMKQIKDTEQKQIQNEEELSGKLTEKIALINDLEAKQESDYDNFQQEKQILLSKLTKIQETLNEEKTDFESNKIKQEEFIAQTLSQLSNTKDSLQKTIQENVELSKELELLNDNISMVNQERKQILMESENNKTRAAEDLNNLKQNFFSLESKLENEKTRNKELLEKIQLTESTTSEIKISYEQFKLEKGEEINKLLNNLNTVKHELAKITETNDQLLEKIQIKDDTIVAIRNENAQSVLTTTEEIEKLNTDLDTFDRKLAEERRRVSEKNNEIEDLQGKCEKYRKQLEHTQDKLDAEQLQLGELIKENTEEKLLMQKDIRFIQNKFNEAESERSELSKDKSNLENNVEEVQKRIAESEQEHKILLKKFVSLQQELKELNVSYQNQMKENHQLHHSFEKQIKDNQLQLEYVESLRQAEVKEKLNLKHNMEGDRHKYEVECEKFEKVIKSNRAQIDELRESLAQTEKSSVELFDSKTNLEKVNASVKAELQIKEQAVHDLKLHLEQTEITLSDTKNELYLKDKKLNENIAFTSQNKKEYEKTLNSVHADFNQVKEEYLILENKMNSVSLSLEKVEKEKANVNKQLQNSLQQKQEIQTELGNRNSHLQEEYLVLENKMNSVSLSLEKVEKEKANLNNQLQTSLQQKEEIQTELGNRNSHLQEEYLVLENKLNSVSLSLEKAEKEKANLNNQLLTSLQQKEEIQTELGNRNSHLQEDYLVLENKLNSVALSLEKAEKEKANVNKQLQTSLQQKEEIETELGNRNSYLQNLINELEESMQENKRDLESLTIELKTERDNFALKNEEVDLLNRKIKDSQEYFDNRETLFENQTEENKKIFAEKIELLNKQLEQSFSSLEEANQTISDQTQKARDQEEKQNKKINELISHIESAKKEISDCHNIIKKKNEDCMLLQKKIELNEPEILNLRNIVENAKKSEILLIENAKNAKKNEENLKEVINKQTTEIQIVREENKKCISIIEQKETEVNSVNFILESTKKEMQVNYSKLKEIEKTQEQQTKKLEEQLAAKTKENAEILQNNLNMDILTLSETLETQAIELDETREELENAKKMIKEHEIDIKCTTQQLASKNSEDKSKAKIDYVTNITKENAKLKKELMTLQTKYGSLKSQLRNRHQ